MSELVGFSDSLLGSLIRQVDIMAYGGGSDSVGQGDCLWVYTGFWDTRRE